MNNPDGDLELAGVYIDTSEWRDGRLEIILEFEAGRSMLITGIIATSHLLISTFRAGAVCHKLAGPVSPSS